MIDRSIPTERSGEESGSGTVGVGFRNFDAVRVDVLRDLDAFAQVAEIFLEDGPHLIETIGQALAAGDFAAAEQAAHRMKGSSANLGALQLSNAFRQLESLAREGDSERCRELLQAAQARYQAVEEELEEIRAREDAG